MCKPPISDPMTENRRVFPRVLPPSVKTGATVKTRPKAVKLFLLRLPPL
jgi:hypothetical protein